MEKEQRDNYPVCQNMHCARHDYREVNHCKLSAISYENCIRPQYSFYEEAPRGNPEVKECDNPKCKKHNGKGCTLICEDHDTCMGGPEYVFAEYENVSEEIYCPGCSEACAKSNRDNFIEKG